MDGVRAGWGKIGWGTSSAGYSRVDNECNM